MAAGVLVAMAAAAALNLCEPFHEEATDLHGYWQCDGTAGLPARYVLAEDFTPGGIAAVMDHTGWHYIDRQGRFVLRPMIYDNGPDYFVEGLARFVEDGKMGFFDMSGRIIVPARYDFAFPFENGVAQVGHYCQIARHHEHSAVSCQRWSTLKRPVIPPLTR